MCLADDATDDDDFGIADLTIDLDVELSSDCAASENGSISDMGLTSVELDPGTEASSELATSENGLLVAMVWLSEEGSSLVTCVMINENLLQLLVIIASKSFIGAYVRC